MKTKYVWRAMALLAVALSPTLESSARATVTNVAWYRLGENDPGAAHGSMPTNSIDVVSNRVLTLVGGPFYDANVASSASVRVGSSLGVRFSSATWGTNALVSTVVDNFGMELWVNPSVLAGSHMLAYNGHTGTSGWGLNLANGIYSVLFGGQAVIGSVPAASNVWMHLALVRDGGITTFYTNGVAAATSAVPPNFPAGLFGVANAPNPPGSAIFQGVLDEVRVFTFGAGQFTTNDLLVNRPILFSVTTTGPTLVTTNSATLNGTINPAGFPTTAWFEWGPYSVLCGKTAVINLPATNGPISVTSALTDLTPTCAYHYRLMASNAMGVVRGRTLQFWAPVLTVNGNDPLSIKHQVWVDPSGATAHAAPIGIAAGYMFNLALKADGTILNWGINFPNATKVLALSAGVNHRLGLKPDGTVLAWGDNAYGQITIPPSATNVVAVSAGALHSLALKADGTIVAWGYNAYGQSNIPPWATNVVAISAGYFHNLAMRADGTILGWGDNANGQSSIPVGATNIIAIAAGYFHNLALRADGVLFAWGRNSNGQTDIPPGATNLIALVPGGYHSMVLKADGSVMAWGWNNAGQINIPASVSNVVALAAGHSHNLAMRADGTIIPWGDNTYNQNNVPSGLTNLIMPVVSSHNINTNVLGSYQVNYFVTNTYGAVATASRTVLVIDSPTIAANPSATVIGTNSANGLRTVRFSASINPNGSPTIVQIPYGLSPGYGNISTTNILPGAFTFQLATIDVPLSPGFTWHWRVNANNGVGTIPGSASSPDQILFVPPAGVPGDANGDGYVGPSEFADVLANLNNNGVISQSNWIRCFPTI